MRSIRDIRKDNLKYIIDTRFSGVVNRTARAIGVQQSQIARVFAKGEYRRNVGDGLARKIEEALSLEDGWLDQEHAASDAISIKLGHLNHAQRTAVMSIVDEFIATSKFAYGPDLDPTEQTYLPPICLTNMQTILSCFIVSSSSFFFTAL